MKEVYAKGVKMMHMVMGITISIILVIFGNLKSLGNKTMYSILSKGRAQIDYTKDTLGGSFSIASWATH